MKTSCSSLQDPTQANEMRKNDKVYRIRRGMLMIHEDNQANDYSYWRTIVPDNEEVKIELLKRFTAYHTQDIQALPGHWR